MKCPNCNKNVSELDEICPHCKKRLIESDENVPVTSSNAHKLNIMANILLVISFIIAILIWVNFSIIYDEINWYGIFGGIITVIFGYTQFLSFKTLVDIYNK